MLPIGNMENNLNVVVDGGNLYVKKINSHLLVSVEVLIKYYTRLLQEGK